MCISILIHMACVFALERVLKYGSVSVCVCVLVSD